MNVYQDFSAQLDPRWRSYLAGNGRLEQVDSALRLIIEDATPRRYGDAQLDDYQGLPRHGFSWRPPLRLSVRARFSHAPGDGQPGLRGTAGFGFWNDPFVMTGGRVPALPRAIWFFYASPPSNMQLDPQAPGYGWKAATIDATRTSALPLAFLAPLAVPLMNLRPLYRVMWPPIQRALRIREALLNVDMTVWHTYVLEWGAKLADFSVDD
jgi:hypothetical protein